jgi:hypothetical protein
MKRFLTTMILTVALSSFAFAGEIPSLGAASLAPSGSGPAVTTTSPSEIPSDGAAARMSESALSALLTILGLLSI